MKDKYLTEFEAVARKLVGITSEKLDYLLDFRRTYSNIRNRVFTPTWVLHPLNIQIDTHNYCNLWLNGKGCIHCNVKPSGGWNLPRGWMPSEMIKYIIEYWGKRGAYSVAPYINGEPLMDDRLLWISSLAEKNRMTVVIDTNGTLYDKRKSLVHCNNSQVRITFSATTPETYFTVHGADYFSEVRDTILWFLKNRKSTQYPMLYFITDKFNLSEVFDYVKTWMGKAHMTIFPLHEVRNIQTESEKTKPKDSLYWLKICEKLTGKRPYQPSRPIDIYPNGIRRIRYFPHYITCQGTSSFSVAWTGELLHCTDIPYHFNYGYVYDHDMLEVWHKRNICKLNHPACRNCNVKSPNHDKILKKFLNFKVDFKGMTKT